MHILGWINQHFSNLERPSPRVSIRLDHRCAYSDFSSELINYTQYLTFMGESWGDFLSLLNKSAPSISADHCVTFRSGYLLAVLGRYRCNGCVSVNVWPLVIRNIWSLVPASDLIFQKNIFHCRLRKEYLAPQMWQSVMSNVIMIVVFTVSSVLLSISSYIDIT